MKRNFDLRSRQPQTEGDSQTNECARALLCGRPMINFNSPPSRPRQTIVRSLHAIAVGGKSSRVLHALMVALVMVVLRELMNCAA